MGTSQKFSGKEQDQTMKKEILKQEREQFFNAVIWRNLSFSAYLGSNLFIKTQQKFNCPKSIIKTPEKVVKRF